MFVYLYVCLSVWSLLRYRLNVFLPFSSTSDINSDNNGVPQQYGQVMSPPPPYTPTAPALPLTLPTSSNPTTSIPAESRGTTPPPLTASTTPQPTTAASTITPPLLAESITPLQVDGLFCYWCYNWGSHVTENCTEPHRNAHDAWL